MFIEIKAQSANTILISVPTETSAKSLPSIVEMLENNAVFLHDGWSSLDVIKPKISISLFDEYTAQGGDVKYTVKSSDAVLSDDFVHCTPEVLVSFKEASKGYKETIEKLKKQISALETLNENLRAEIDKADQED